MKQELHITLWHHKDPVFGTDNELKNTLLRSSGTEVAFEITHIDYSLQGLAAARVQVIFQASIVSQSC